MRHFLSIAGIVWLLWPCCIARAQEYGTITGRTVWGGQQVPERPEVKVNVDAAFILQANLTANPLRGTIQDNTLLINPANKGIKNVYVWLLPKKPGEKLPVPRRLGVFSLEPVVIYTHAGTYRPAAAIMREGQTLVIKNLQNIGYATRLTGDPIFNAGGAFTLTPGKDFVVKDLRAQRLPLILDCAVHGWMKGRVGIYNHPYYATTDLNGAFEIKHAPVGDFAIMVYHDRIGYRLGAMGKNGEPIAIKGGVNDMGLLKMGP
jgi:hypothetical protein